MAIVSPSLVSTRESIWQQTVCHNGKVTPNDVKRKFCRGASMMSVVEPPHDIATQSLNNCLLALNILTG